MLRSSSAQQQIQSIQRSVAAITRALKRLRPLVKQRGSAAAGAAPRRRLNLSPKRKAALKLHGKYLGHVRQLRPAQRAKVKELKARKGYHAAIALAQRLKK